MGGSGWRGGGGQVLRNLLRGSVRGARHLRRSRTRHPGTAGPPGSLRGGVWGEGRMDVCGREGFCGGELVVEFRLEWFCDW